MIELQPGPDVEQEDVVPSNQIAEFCTIDVAGGTIPGSDVAHNFANLGELRFSRCAQSEPQREDILACQPIDDARTFALGLHEVGRLKGLEVLGRVRHRHVGLLSQSLDVPGSLGQKVEKLQTPFTGESCADPGELGVDLILDLSVSHAPILAEVSQYIKCSSPHLTRGMWRAIVWRVQPGGEADGPPTSKENGMATTRATLNTDELMTRVKEMYREVADHPEREFHFHTGRALAERLGYPSHELDAIPAEAIASFAGVGYYFDLAGLTPGETVVDLGSGSGMDSLIAARQVGSAGRVVGIDMTDAQLGKARRLAEQAGFINVEFCEAQIEQLPVRADSADVVISNGVINLSPEKGKVFAETARVLRAGGRLAIADIVTAIQLPEGVTCSASLWAACIGGAMQRDDYRDAIENAGFSIEVVRDNDQYGFVSESAASATKTYGVRSVSILARKNG